MRPFIHPPRARLLALICAAWPALLVPGAATAHPHVFIDAGLDLVLDADGRLEEVRVTWVYDPLYSLILLEDYGLDGDGDLILTEAEVAEVLGFDLNWNGGFDGGLQLARGGADLEVGAPSPVALSLTPEGQLVSVHRRPVRDPGGAGDITATIHDPAFYVAFEMTGPMTVTGPGRDPDADAAGPAPCVPRLERADLDAAYAALEAVLDEIGGVLAAEDDFPAVGALFADVVVFECSR